MKEKAKILIIMLVSIIFVLCCILGYGVYTGFKVKAEINRLNEENNQLNMEKQDLTSQLDLLQKKYDLLEEDVRKIYKGCITENACKGHYPSVSWYCNNVGDEIINNPSHVCVCDSSCNLKATQI